MSATVATPHPLSLSRSPVPRLEHETSIACERAVTYLVDQRLDERRAGDGRCVGIQATLATGPHGDNPIELYSIIDGLVTDPRHLDQLVVDELDRALWREIAELVRIKLGFPLEPELFSNMLFVAYTAGLEHVHLRRLCTTLLPTFRDAHLGGLYHFFSSTRFACDIDCTAMATRARLELGDLDPSTNIGAAELHRINSQILRSAAVVDVPAERNRSHGKDNGPLRRGVLKVYRDDHLLQGSEYDRGLKNNPVVVANALFPLLLELAAGLRDPAEPVRLRELGADGVMREGCGSVAEIIAANVCYCAGHLLTGEWARGCRYYPSPDAFLCFYSELAREFPELTAPFGARELLVDAIETRRATPACEGAANPERTLNTALRAIAAANVGLSAEPELVRLLASQADDGHWRGYDCLFTLGSVGEGLPVHFGSPLVTAAFCVRALSPALGRRLRSRLRVEDGWARPILARIERG
jgi:hypothetical protein